MPRSIEDTSISETHTALAANAAEAADLLKAMANPNRLMILCVLAAGEQSVNALNQFVPLSQSALSQHLAALRKADLVSTRRESQVIYYNLVGDKPHAILAVLKQLYCPEMSSL